jgi:hypothetical protein
MAGPLSSEEIEDVVSSVRRLVSNEQRPRTLSRDLGAERLLLTPALRVLPDSSPLAPLVLDAPLPEPPPEKPDLAVGEPAPAATRDPQPPTAEDTPQDDFRSGADATDSCPEPQVGEGDLADSATAETLATPQSDAEWEEGLWVEPGAVSLGEVALAAEEAVVAAAEVDEAPLAAGDADAVEARTRDDSDWSEKEPVPFVPLRRRAEHLAARVAAGEVLDTARPGPGEAVADAADAREAEAAPVASGAEGGPAHLATELVDADGTPLAVLDEAALQEIVRQTLRSELQGELGERITRSVRKLVRAEINRALIARDLD